MSDHPCSHHCPQRWHDALRRLGRLNADNFYHISIETIAACEREARIYVDRFYPHQPGKDCFYNYLIRIANRQYMLIQYHLTGRREQRSLPHAQ